MISADKTELTSMYTVRRAQERGRTQLDWLDSWHSFSFGEYLDPEHHHWGALRVINDDIVKPGSGFGTHPHKDMEIVTWVISGTLKHQDSLGNGTLIPAGDIQRMSAGSGIQHSEWNPSETDPVHLLQIWIRPEAKNSAPSYEQKTVIFPEMLTDWVEVASPQGGEHAVTLHQYAWIFTSGVVQSQSKRRVTTQPNQCGWLQVIRGSVVLASGGEALSAGDGLAVQSDAVIHLDFAPQSEALWFLVPEA